MGAALPAGRTIGVTGPFDGQAVISGAGKSQVGRRLGRSGLELTVEAVLRAIADAGLRPDDIDGGASYPGAAAPDPGFSGATVTEPGNALGIRQKRYIGGIETQPRSARRSRRAWRRPPP